jgi:hypothetical protein
MVDSWIPVASAGAALVGGAAGSWLQATFSTRSWRRQTRLDAYARFVEAEHEFHNALLSALDQVGTLDDWEGAWAALAAIDANAPVIDVSDVPSPVRVFIQDLWRKVLDAELALGRAGSLVSLAGPPDAGTATQNVLEVTRAITDDRKDLAQLRVAAARVGSGRYQKLLDWVDCAEDFDRTARKVLGTDKLR